MSKYDNQSGPSRFGPSPYSVATTRSQFNLRAPTPKTSVRSRIDTWLADRAVARREIEAVVAARTHILEQRVRVAVAEESFRIINGAAVNIARMSRQAADETSNGIKDLHRDSFGRTQRAHVEIDGLYRELDMQVQRGELSQTSAEMQKQQLERHREIEFGVDARVVELATHQLAMIVQGGVMAVRAVMPLQSEDDPDSQDRSAI